MSPALAGRFSTTAPPGKPTHTVFTMLGQLMADFLPSRPHPRSCWYGPNCYSSGHQFSTGPSIPLHSSAASPPPFCLKGPFLVILGPPESLHLLATAEAWPSSRYPTPFQHPRASAPVATARVCHHQRGVQHPHRWLLWLRATFCLNSLIPVNFSHLLPHSHQDLDLP